MKGMEASQSAGISADNSRELPGPLGLNALLLLVATACSGYCWFLEVDLGRKLVPHDAEVSGK